MFASTVLNYMDRQTITLVQGQISEAFAIPSFAEFGWILAAFSMTYALFQVPAGYLVDRWDLRWSYAAAVAWWSLAAMATAIVPTLGWLIVCRALLGVGESFNWPCALRVTARVLPPADRSLGNGIFNSGAAVGAVLTPIVVTVLSPQSGLARRRFWSSARSASSGSRSGSSWFAATQRDARPPRDREGRATSGPGDRSPVSRRRRGSRSPIVGFAAATAGLLCPSVWSGGRVARDRAGDARDRWPSRGYFPVRDLGSRGWAISLHEIVEAQEVLDSGRRLDLDQHLLAFPDQLGSDVPAGLNAMMSRRPPAT